MMPLFDFEGMLFINFPPDKWVSGEAQRIVEAQVVADGFDVLTYVTVLCAIGELQAATMKDLKPWEIEALRLEWAPQSASRFPPYWKPNGGTHDIAEHNQKPDLSAWDFGEAPAADAWSFDAAPATSAGWNF